jgi:hypothetical protein
MALLLAEAEKLSLPQLQQGVIENVVTSDELFAVIPFQPIDGKVFQYDRENSIGSAAFVAVSGTIAESAATFTQLEQTLKRILGDVDVDEFLDATMSDQQSQTSVQIGKKSKSVGRKFADAMINGDEDTTAAEFDGLRALYADLASSQKTIAGAQGAAFSFDMLDVLIDQNKVGTGAEQAFVMNSRTLRAYVALQRGLGGIVPETTIEDRVFSSYRGRPILKNDYVPLTEDSDGVRHADVSAWVLSTAYALGDKVIAVGTPNATQHFKCTTAGTSDSTEPATWNATAGGTTSDGTVTWTTMNSALASVFILTPDEEEGFTGLMSSKAAGIQVIDVGPISNKDTNRWRVRWYTAVVLKSGLALAGITGVNN